VGHCASSAQSSNASTTGVEMTDEEKQTAEAYIKLHADVKELILDTIMDELQLNYQGPFANYVRNHVLMSTEAEQKIKGVIINQMNKY
jgi:hypothetical protein